MHTNEERSRIAYPELPNPLSARDLTQLFTPWPDEIDWASNATWTTGARLGLLTLLKVFETLGRFVGIKQIPPEVVRHIARHIGLPERERLAFTKNTLYRHQGLVREFLGVTKWNEQAHDLAENVMEQLVSTRTQPADQINAAVEVLIRERFELPALRTLRRLAGAVQQRIHNRLFDRVANRLTEAHRTALDALLEVPKDADESPFAKLCRPPGRATAKNLTALADHLDWLEALAVPPAALADIMPVKIEQWADEAKRLIATELREYQTPRRHALLAALVHISRAHILDDLVTMLIKSVRKIRHQAEAELQAWLAERQESSEQLIIILLDLARAHQGTGEQGFSHQAAVIFAAAGGSDQIVKRREARLEHRVRDWRPFARKHFVSRRSALMDLGEVLPLKAMPGSEGLLHAFNSVVAWRSDREPWIKVKLDTNFLDRSWAKHVCDPDEPGVYNRRLLEVAAFFELAEALQSGAVYVPGSSSYGAYTDHLYPIESDPQAVTTYLQGRGLPDNAEAFVTELRVWLNSHIRNLDSFVGELGVVELNGAGLPIVRRPPANKPTESALALEKALLGRLPQRTILEALYNTDAWTGWTRHFGPPGRLAPQIDHPSMRYVLTSFAYGCGLGPTQASRHFEEGVPAHRLAFANRRHISTADLRAACNDLINLYAQFGLPLCWGSGESAAADGSLLETYEENLFAAHHVRYGRSGGVAYRHVADTYIALFSHFIPCGVHEAVYILDGLLKNTSDVQPNRLHADTHGQSATVFALAYLLGIELMPRIRSWRSLTFYRTGTPGYPIHTRNLYSGTIDWALIQAHWDDYLRVVLAIQSGRVSASWVLARLNRYSRHSRRCRPRRVNTRADSPRQSRDCVAPLWAPCRPANRRAWGDAQTQGSRGPRRSPVMSSPLWQGHTTRMAEAAHETPANELYLAFQELGRVVRTVYLLNWITDDALRAGVTDGANKVETFHEFSDYLNFGSQGILKTNDPTEQEKMTVYNQLVANAVMLQNVADQTRVLHELHLEGYPINLDDLVFMSPYVTQNLKRFGDYPTQCQTEPLPDNKGLPR